MNPIIEEKKQLDIFETKFVKMVEGLHKNTYVVFVSKKNKPKAVLMTEKKFEEIESVLETADILLKNPNILDELKKAKKQAKHAKPLTLEQLKV